MDAQILEAREQIAALEALVEAAYRMAQRLGTVEAQRREQLDEPSDSVVS